VYVFGYASLVSPESVERTLDAAPSEFHLASLAGWRRDWLVGSDRTSHPEREFVTADEATYDGVVVVLGIAEAAGADCGGAVFSVSPGDLSQLDVRERNYRRIDVTAGVSWLGKPAHCTVHTYVPLPRARERIELAVRRGRPVAVRAGYLALVEKAFRDQGRLAEFWASTPRPRFPVTELTVRLRDVPPRPASGAPASDEMEVRSGEVRPPTGA
jgi:hypothetical protein